MKQILDPIKRMTYREREKLKQFAYEGRSLREMIVCIAHWFRNSGKQSFEEYAANWAAADVRREMNEDWDSSAIAEAYPMRGPRRIADGCTEWDSFGKVGYPGRKP